MQTKHTAMPYPKLRQNFLTELARQERQYRFLAETLFVTVKDKMIYLEGMRERFSEAGYKIFIDRILAGDPELAAAMSQEQAGRPAELSASEIEQLVAKELQDLAISSDATPSEEEIEEALKFISEENIEGFRPADRTKRLPGIQNTEI